MLFRSRLDQLAACSGGHIGQGAQALGGAESADVAAQAAGPLAGRANLPGGPVDVGRRVRSDDVDASAPSLGEGALAWRRRGRIDAELIGRYVPDPSNCLVYSCGPGVLPWERKQARAKGLEPEPRFIEHMLGLLQDAGLDKSQIKQESWG